VKPQINAQSYHLRYSPDEDRLLVAVDLSPERELAMLVTRRLTRNLIGALAKFVSDRGPVPGANAALRETLLDFEHGHAVAAAKAEGQMRDETRIRQAALPVRLVHEVKLVPKNEGGLFLVFDNQEQLLSIEIASDRIHMVIDTFVQIAERAGWDFPPVASWLDPGKQPEPTTGRVIN